MLLNDIGKSPDSTFRRINQHLEANYGFKISEGVSDKDLVSIMEQIEEEITDLRLGVMIQGILPKFQRDCWF